MTLPVAIVHQPWRHRWRRELSILASAAAAVAALFVVFPLPPPPGGYACECEVPLAAGEGWQLMALPGLGLALAAVGRALRRRPVDDPLLALLSVGTQALASVLVAVVGVYLLGLERGAGSVLAGLAQLALAGAMLARVAGRPR